ncbi:MAG: hypothetical protein GY851_35560 [bacterium]|nr:hypothetical protein [bacterium]
MNLTPSQIIDVANLLLCLGFVVLVWGCIAWWYEMFPPTRTDKEEAGEGDKEGMGVQ